ncbi:MAG: GNAT family N-acetyltransferase [Usitatibacteraceae bacterium]
MLSTANFVYRQGAPSDALCLGILATQVFLDTYATNGIDADLAREALSVYSPGALEQRLLDPNAEMTVVECGDYVVAFLDVSRASECPVSGIVGPEVLRLYVQAPFQRHGLGRELLRRAEATARLAGAKFVWLTAWSGNVGALGFYAAAGYVDVGETQYVIEGKAYENRVFAKSLALSMA